MGVGVSHKNEGNQATDEFLKVRYRGTGQGVQDAEHGAIVLKDAASVFMPGLVLQYLREFFHVYAAPAWATIKTFDCQHVLEGQVLRQVRVVARHNLCPGAVELESRA